MFAATRLSTSIFLTSSRVSPPVSRLRLNMSTTERAAHLEDLEDPTTVKQAATGVSKNTSEVLRTDGATPSKREAKVVGGERKSTATTAVKRQRNLMDMFSGSASSSAPAAKRLKVAATSSTVTATTSALSSQPSLNSIPFSMSEFEAAMSDEERKLLDLECETLGKSWYGLIVT